MLDYVKQVMRILPVNCGNTFVTATLIGLRAEEVCQSIRLLKQCVKDNYDPGYGVLEHLDARYLYSTK
jgi:hypothetical protein